MVVACGGSTGAGAGTSGTGASTDGTNGTPAGPTTGVTGGSGDDAAVLADARRAVEKGYAGTYGKPGQGPPAVKGKQLAVLLSAYANYGDHEAAEGIKEASKAIGWRVKTYDGKGTPEGQNAALRQAIADKPDGIVAIATDCANVTSAYQKAKDAGIPVIGLYQFDCGDPSVGGKDLFTSTVHVEPGGPRQFYLDWGKLHADYLIARTNAAAKVVQFATKGFRNVEYEVEGFEARMKQCQRCDIVATQNLTATDIVSGSTATKVGSTITANASKANSAFFDNDSIMTGAANILRAQRKQGWVVLGGEGTTKAFQMVRDGEVDALFVIDNTMNGFCSVFLMNQVFAGTKLVPCGLGFTIVDKEHNLPPEGEKFTPSLDFRSIYMKQWSGS